MAYVPPAKQLFADADSPRELVARREEFVQEMTKATVAGLVGETVFFFVQSFVEVVVEDALFVRIIGVQLLQETTSAQV